MRLIRKLFGGFDPSLKELTDEQMGRIWGAGGSGGQSGETVYKWNDDMARQWAGDDNLLGLLPRANEVSNRGFTPYGGQRVADLSFDQQGAGDSIRHAATAGTTLGNEGRNTAFTTARGDFLGSNPQNANRVTPGTSQYEDLANSTNPYETAFNPYEGNNEAFLDMKRRSMRDMADMYNEGTAADTQRMFAQSGAFGGSAHQQAVQRNSDTLAKNMGDLGNRMESEQYDRSAGLRESAIGRASNLREAALGRSYGARESAIDRGMQGQMFDIDRLSRDYQFERGNQQNAAQMAMQGEQGIMDLYRQRMGVGDLYRDRDQRIMDVNYGDWTQGQDWDRNNINWLASLLGTAQGSTGVTQQFGGYQGVNPVAGLLGAAALGRGMDFF